MPQAYNQGAYSQSDYQSSIRLPIFGIAVASFVNRTPLFSRLAQVPLDSPSFKTSSMLFRPRSTTANGSGSAIASGATTLPVAANTGSMFQTGDTIEVGSEELKITAVSGDNLTVTRGYAGTTAASIADGATIYLLSNARTGGEINVAGISRIPTVLTQWAQTFQYPYAVGGALAASNLALPPGISTVVGRERYGAMLNAGDDIETAFYYGRQVALTAPTDTPKMSGIRQLISTNNTTSPTNASAYMPSDLLRDTIAKCFANGGQPDTLLVSNDFQIGLAQWGAPLQRLEAGTNEYGVPIDLFCSSFVPNVQIIPAPLLRAGTAICLSSGEVRHRVKRAMFDKPRGSRGDAEEGDVIYEGAIEVDNESHHAIVTGVTGYAKQS